jgi:hypothetical protein
MRRRDTLHQMNRLNRIPVVMLSIGVRKIAVIEMLIYNLQLYSRM